MPAKKRSVSTYRAGQSSTRIATTKKKKTAKRKSAKKTAKK